MAMGLKIPVGVDQRGRAAVEKNESVNTNKILKLAFAEGNDNNPFQQLGVDKRLIFSVKNAAFNARALRAVQVVLAKFAELVRLVESSVNYDETIEGELKLSFNYIDLQTNKEEQFIATLQRPR